MKIKEKERKRLLRKKRVRKKVFGFPERPRLAVHCSLKHTYAQLINDVEGKTLTSASTLSPELKGKIKFGGNKEAAKAVGELIGEKIRALKIEKIVFDRGEKLFHGRVKALAEAVRKKGVNF
jgi:large subunit ribosomal protein L18